MMKCIKGSFITVNKFITEDLELIYVYPFQNLWNEIEDKIGYEVFIQIDKNNFVKDCVFVL